MADHHLLHQDLRVLFLYGLQKLLRADKQCLCIALGCAEGKMLRRGIGGNVKGRVCLAAACNRDAVLHGFFNAVRIKAVQRNGAALPPAICRHTEGAVIQRAEQAEFAAVHIEFPRLPLHNAHTCFFRAVLPEQRKRIRCDFFHFFHAPTLLILRRSSRGSADPARPWKRASAAFCRTCPR